MRKIQTKMEKNTRCLLVKIEFGFNKSPKLKSQFCLVLIPEYIYSLWKMTTCVYV